MDHASGDHHPDHHHRPGHGGDFLLAHALLLPHYRLRHRAQHGQRCLPEHSLWLGCKTSSQVHRSGRSGIGESPGSQFTL